MNPKSMENITRNRIDKLDPERARELRAKGGRAAAKSKHMNCCFRDTLLELLSEGSTMEDLCREAISAAADEHNMQAFAFIRDTIGQKPVDRKEVNANVITNDQREAALRAYLLSTQDEKDEA